MFCLKCNNEFIKIYFCESCGTIHNNVKEQRLTLDINPTTRKIPPKKTNSKRGNSSMHKPSTQIKLNPPPKAILTTPKSPKVEPKTTHTSEIHAKATSPTLVEFQTKNSQIPEWRLQLKNAVQKRIGQNNDDLQSDSNTQTITVAPAKSYPTNGGNALKAEVIEENNKVNADNEQLAKALKRIEQSRRKYYVAEVELPVETTPDQEKPAKDYPFKIASRNKNPITTNDEESNSSVNFPAKPKLVPTTVTHTNNLDLYDTSELDPEFLPAKVSSSFDKIPTTPPVKEPKKIELDVEKETNYIYSEANKIKPEVIEKKKVADVTEAGENDDLAPFALRFNAGLFDLIIGSFASLVLLSPFMLLGGNWFTLAGFFAFLATTAIVMFIYMTTTIGTFGKTFGMHLFSLEMIDFNDDEYPTFHQAAVSSSIYLLSLAFFGLGFVTSFFDEEKRAVHDLVSGTLVVKEI